MAQQKPGSWEAVLEELPSASLLVDAEGTILSANELAATLIERSATQLTRQPLLDVIPLWRDSAISRLFDVSAAALGDGVEEAGELELPLGEERWVRVCLKCVTDAHQQQPVLLLILSEITELVRLKQRLRWTEYQASIGKLARGIAHELNNPLDGVMRYTHLALEQLTDDSPLREYLLHVKEGLDRMVRAARAFLEFSRQVTTPVNRLVELHSLIDDALLLLHHRAKFQQIQVVKQLEEPLPKIPDAGLQYAIVNLIKNAFDAMPRGGTLTISACYSDAHIDVDIEDTGVGISEEIRPHLFEPFFSTKPIHQGSGLGLVMAKEVVERSGGRIECTSQVGVGTTFRLHIPIVATPHQNGVSCQEQT